MAHVRWRLFAAVLLAFASSLIPSSATFSADDGVGKEAKMFAITTWDDDCSGAARGSWDDMVDAWYDRLTVLPWYLSFLEWSRSGRQADGDIVDSFFADSTVAHPWGEDFNNTDDADAVMIAMHGGNDSGDHRWYGTVRVDEPGTGDCEAYQGDMVFGDKDLEFLHLSSCNSMDYEDWWSEWSSSFDGLHQADGFHGVMWISSSYPTYYEDFALDALFMGMGDAWLDNLYIKDISGTDDQCPVARNVGSSSLDSLFRMDLEGYFIVGTDPLGLGVTRNHRARYIPGCDPNSEDPLP